MRRILSFLGLCLAFALAGAPVHAQKNKAGLIAAWEQEQKSDPETTTLEKTADGQYHFATKRFPFDGVLLVRNASIEDVPTALKNKEMATGTVEVELQGLPDNFREIYGSSYARWRMTNTLYWSGETNRWMTSEEYFRSIQNNLPTGFLWPFMPVFGWMAILLIVLGVVVYNAWRANRRVAAINKRNERVVEISERNAVLGERNAALFEENTKIFREILEELKKLNGSRQPPQS